VAPAGLQALRTPAFRRYLLGQTVSLAGTWTQQVAVAWLTFQLTASSTAVAMTLVLAQLPALLLSPLAGLLSDRFNRRDVLIGTQLASAAQAGLLALTYGVHGLNVIALLAFSGLSGLIGSFDGPARQSLIPGLVGRRADIRNAVALSAASVHVARLVGPAVAAIALARVDAQACFLANALSSMAFCAALLTTPRTNDAHVHGMSLAALRDGWAYCASHRKPRQALSWIAITSLLAIPYPSLLPAILTAWSHPTPLLYAQLMTAAGAGAVGAALALARSESDAPLRLAMPLSLLWSALALVALAVTGQQMAVGTLMTLVASVGFGLTIVISGGNVLLQHNVADALRGRVMGLFIMSFNGLAGLGALMLGFLGDRFGATTALAAAGATAGLAVIVRAATRLAQLSPLRE